MNDPSRPDDPENPGDVLSGPHPDELLAGYVDGTATAAERAAAETHLGSCAQCRAEVELATMGRAAMVSLPQVESPGIAAAGLGGLGLLPEPGSEPQTPAVRASRRSGRRLSRRWERIAWGTGLAAAAASLVVIFAVSHPGGGSSTAPAAARAGSTSTRGPSQPPSVRIVNRGADYSPSSANALAAALAGTAKDSLSPSRPAAGQFFESDNGAVFTCLQQGAGLSAADTPYYLEVATYQGMPAYIGAFVSPASGAIRGHLLLVVVSRQGCQPLYVVRQAL